MKSKLPRTIMPKLKKQKDKNEEWIVEKEIYDRQSTITTALFEKLKYI